MRATLSSALVGAALVANVLADQPGPLAQWMGVRKRTNQYRIIFLTVSGRRLPMGRQDRFYCSSPE